MVIFCFNSFATNETLSSGAFIINMGITPQTIANGLKPYGLVYDLLKNKQVPIKWIINTSKLKDSADFTYNGVKFRGGPFIIPAEYRTAAVNTIISNWVAAGVIGTTTTAPITVEVYLTLRFVPQWTLDKDNGNLVTDFFINAGIPASAHGGSTSSGWKLPSQLNGCDDIFVLPHADPTWTTHQNLYFWNQTHKGNIWSACHGVSELENITNPGATIRMNFLSTNGLLLNGAHKDGSPPYNYQYPTDQVMQFMGSFDGATTNGSEQIYLPKLSSSWRSGTRMLVFDPTQQDIPLKSLGPAAVAIYGRAFNDSTRGFVMYEGGHDLNKGTVPERVAAQRAFFNYSFYAANIKSNISISMANIPGVVRRGDTINIDFDLPPGYNAANFRKKWTSSCGGTFRPNDTVKLAKFIVPTNPLITSCVISIKITDACGRENFASKQIFIISGILENGWGNLNAKQSGKDVLLTWKTNAEENQHIFVVEKSSNGTNFSIIGYVMAKEITEELNTYYFTDKSPGDGQYYYRIRALDKQSHAAVSNTVSINIKSQGFRITIAPNPITQSSLINFYSDKKTNAALTIINIAGSLLAAKSIELQKGETRFDFPDLKTLLTGIYLLKVQVGLETYYEKFFVSK